jgi:hypothetical protein
MRRLALALLAPTLLTHCTPSGDECSVDADCLVGQVCRNVPEREALACLRATPSAGDAGPGDVEPVVIESFTADAAVVARGGSTTLRWRADYASSCALSAGIGGVPVEGTAEVTPERNTEFTLSCQGPSGPAIARVPVALEVEVLSFAVSRLELNAGTEVTVFWQSAGATRCLLNYPFSSYEIPALDFEDGSFAFSPAASGEVSVTCDGAAGPASATATLEVARIQAFAASPPAVAAGEQVSLSWSADHVTGCVVSDLQGPFDDEVAVVQVDETTTFTLLCDGHEGELAATVQVPVLILGLSAAQDTVAAGASTTLSFSVAPEVSACTVNDFTVPLDQSYDTGPLTQTGTFTLECQRADGVSAQAAVTVTVLP